MCKVQSLNVHQKDQALRCFGYQEGSISHNGLLVQLAEKHIETSQPACKLPGNQDKKFTLRVHQKSSTSQVF